ncbi:hypothetical protein RhiirA1_522574 [Rhizophagus irregularis]|uniref:Uncharacterized protein n=1 Tax=Rhizophagus irregularis TaxID=588596 RepID=A0A2N0RFY4_9GLOM|nr:hypothetical protein RhiirA1_522574 [Rhizophagus irregularis]CAB4495455.1 unnamed protein product [Rhizophagus irregularis]CAB5388157.1 unnamed protein product [Rhizophagus irregularis]
MVDIYKINSVINKIKGAEQQNTLNKEALDKKVREQEHICNELWWEKGDQNIKKLTENTQEIMGLVRNQNDITRCAFSLNRDTLKLLEDISVNTREDIKYLRRIIKDLTVTKEFFRYGDWVTKLIQDIVRKSDKKLEDINGASAWDIISYEFSIMIKYDHEKIKDEEIDIDHFSPDAREYIKPLKKNLR